MAKRFYVTPATVIDYGDFQDRSPKYMDTAGVTSYGMMDYAMDPVVLVGAEVTTEQHTAISGNADVLAIPVNLDASLGNQRNAVSSYLEARNIPAAWATTGTTWRQVMRLLIAIFRIAQRFSGMGMGSLFPAGVTLNTAYLSLPANYRAAFEAAVREMGFTMPSVTGNPTFRVVLQDIGVQGTPATLFGIAI